MPDSFKSRPILIPPLVRESAPLEVVNERPEPHTGPQHPHCDEHFLFTLNCAACLGAERTHTATAYATPVVPKAKPANSKSKPDQKSSRSFGFTDNIPASLLHEPTYSEWLAQQAVNDFEGNVIGDIIDTIVDI